MNDDPSVYIDEMGFSAPIPADHGQRRMPEEGFQFGPGLGERVPDFKLPSSLGGALDFHQDRGGSKAALVFIRSAVW